MGSRPHVLALQETPLLSGRSVMPSACLRDVRLRMHRVLSAFPGSQPLCGGAVLRVSVRLLTARGTLTLSHLSTPAACGLGPALAPGRRDCLERLPQRMGPATFRAGGALAWGLQCSLCPRAGPLAAWRVHLILVLAPEGTSLCWRRP